MIFRSGIFSKGMCHMKERGSPHRSMCDATLAGIISDVIVFKAMALDGPTIFKARTSGDILLQTGYVKKNSRRSSILTVCLLSVASSAVKSADLHFPGGSPEKHKKRSFTFPDSVIDPHSCIGLHRPGCNRSTGVPGQCRECRSCQRS